MENRKVIYNDYICRITKDLGDNFHYDLVTNENTEKGIKETFLSVTKDEFNLISEVSPEERRRVRLHSMDICLTAKDLAYNIWTEELEEAVGDRSSYRKPFIEWVESYCKGEKPKQWKYSSPSELAEAIWKPYLDMENDDLFLQLRNHLVMWIESNKK